MKTQLLYGIGGLFAGALALYVLLPDREPVEYTNVIVREIKGEPDTVRTIVDRIVYRDREPEVVVTEPEGATETREAFCRPDTVQVVAGMDTLWLPADTVWLLRSVVDDPGWFFRRSLVTVYGPTSTGDLREMRFRTYPGWSLRTEPAVIFREPRFGWFRELVEAGVYVGIGYLGGKVF